MRTVVLCAGALASVLVCGQAQAGDKLGAVLGGAAVGAVGGVLLGSALSARAQPAPAYYAPPPRRARVVEIEEEAPPPPRVVVERPIDRNPWDDRAFRLHERCDDGDRHACVRFGILIGQHRERVAEWRRVHPDFFSYED